MIPDDGGKVHEIYSFYLDCCRRSKWYQSFLIEPILEEIMHNLVSELKWISVYKVNFDHNDSDIDMECPRGMMVKVMNCGIVVSEFELQSRYNVYFRRNILGKVRTTLSSQLWG